MIAIDIETTGLDPEEHQILEFAAVFENGEHFHRLIRHDDYVISQYCLKLHKQLLKEIYIHDLDRTDLWSLADKYNIKYNTYDGAEQLLPKLHNAMPPIISVDDLGHHFTSWLYTYGVDWSNYDVVGVNWAGFDGLFLKKVPEFPTWNYKVLELGSLYFDGTRVLGLKEIEPIDNPHRALPDAQATMKAFLRKRTELQSVVNLT